MKKKKGFTLVELISVIVILTILFILSFPTILGVLSKTNIKVTNAQILLIKDATEDYINSRKDIYNQNLNDKYCVKLQTLIDENLITKKQIEDIEATNIINITILEKGIEINIATKCNK